MKCNLCSRSVWSANWGQINNRLLFDRDRLETYKDDSSLTVRIKCGGIFLANPLRLICYIITALAKSLLLFVAAVFKTLSILAEAVVYEFTKADLMRRYREEFASWPAPLHASLLSPWLTIYYGTFVEIGAFIGLFDPFRGRKIVAQVEKEWSGYDYLLAKKVIMAPCFQPRAVRGVNPEGISVIFSV